MLKKIEFDGKEFEYDPGEATSYRNIKRLARAKVDTAAFFDAFESIFSGRDEEYADILGNDFDKIGMLVSAVIEAEGTPAKN